MFLLSYGMLKADWAIVWPIQVFLSEWSIDYHAGTASLSSAGGQERTNWLRRIIYYIPAIGLKFGK